MSLNQDPPETIRILFAEDLMDHALLVRTFLASVPGYQVTHCQDGVRAIELLRDEEFDLLITDLNLPAADGFEVIRAARAHQRNLPILAVTAYVQEHWWDQAFRAGADQVMVKPLQRDEMLNRIQSLVRMKGRLAQPERKTILVLEGLVGDAAMGCGGTMIQALSQGIRVVVLPLLVDEAVVSAAEMEAAKLCGQMLGVDLRLAEAMVGFAKGGKAALVERLVDDLLPQAIYVPAVDDTHPSRMEASRIAVSAAPHAEVIYGYQTATTGTDFIPTVFVDIAEELLTKKEAVAAFRSLGAERLDMRPRLADAYAHFWGRFRDFGEVEPFEVIRGQPPE